jgi:signal peptidase I
MGEMGEARRVAVEGSSFGEGSSYGESPGYNDGPSYNDGPGYADGGGAEAPGEAPGTGGGGGGRVVAEILDWIKHIVIAIVIGILVITFVGQRTIVYGASMSPTLQNGDQLIIEKISPRIGTIKRGDIVTIYVHGRLEEGKDYLIKRVIALQGDTLEIKDGTVYLNDAPLEEDYVSADYTYNENLRGKITVGEGKVFVMGDNRVKNGSNDSRSLGEFDLSDIRGRAILRWYPFNHFGTLD